MKKYSLDLELIACLETNEPNPNKIPAATLKAAMQKRLDSLVDAEVHEAICCTSVTTNTVQRKK